MSETKEKPLTKAEQKIAELNRRVAEEKAAALLAASNPQPDPGEEPDSPEHVLPPPPPVPTIPKPKAPPKVEPKAEEPIVYRFLEDEKLVIDGSIVSFTKGELVYNQAVIFELLKKKAGIVPVDKNVLWVKCESCGHSTPVRNEG